MLNELKGRLMLSENTLEAVTGFQKQNAMQRFTDFTASEMRSITSAEPGRRTIAKTWSTTLGNTLNKSFQSSQTHESCLKNTVPETDVWQMCLNSL